MTKYFGLLLLAFVLSPTIASASIIRNYDGTEWDTICSNPDSYTGNGFVFGVGSQGVYDCGLTGPLIDLSNGGAGQTVYVTLTLSGATGNFRYSCGGSVTNCSLTTFTASLVEASMVVPVNMGAGDFAYIYFTNFSGSGQGTITGVCVDDDGTSCTSSPPPPPPPPPDNLGAQLSAASSSMEMTTGFDILTLQLIGGTELSKLWLGNSLAFLLLYRVWIVAFIVIGAVLYFSMRAWRFFRH